MRVFLSYGHDHNDWLIDRVAGDLDQAGHSVWRDTAEIRFGDDWRRRIVDGLFDADWTLAFLSRHSTRESGVCLEEWSMVLNAQAGNLATILIEPESEVSMPVSLSRFQWLDMSEWASLKAADPASFETWYKAKLGQILDLLGDPARNEFTGEIAALQGLLDPTGQEAEIGPRLKGVVGRQWLTDAVNKWRCIHVQERVLLLTGPPGVGKSAFAAHLAHRRAEVVAAIHFCRWNVEERCDASRVFRTLAFQLASRLPDYRRLLKDRIAGAHPDELARRGPAAIFDWLIVEPLRFAIDGGRRVDRLLAVIDGLDETLNDGRSLLAETLARGVDKLPPWVAFVITSRPESAVLRQFAHARAVVIAPGSECNEQDLRAYIRQWADSSPELAAGNTEAINRILAAAGGNFLYLSMLRESQISLHLDQVGSELLPRGLVGLYEHWFRRQFRHASEYEKALPLLEIVAAAREPVPLPWAERLLRWPKRERTRVFESLGSLLTHEDGALAFFHKSLFDWLVDENSAGAEYVVDEEAGARRLLTGLWEAFAQWANGNRAVPLDSFSARETPRLAGRSDNATLLEFVAMCPWPSIWEAIGTVVAGLPRERATVLAWRLFAARLAGLCGAPAERSEALRAVGDLQRNLGQREEAYRAYDEALALARDLNVRSDGGPTAKRALVSSLIRHGNRLIVEGLVRDALAAYEEALINVRRLVAEQPNDAADRRTLFVALERLGDARLVTGDAVNALTVFHEGGALITALAEGAPSDLALRRDVAVNFAKSGDASMDLGDSDGALVAWEQSLTVARAPRDIFAVLVRIGDARLQRGESSVAAAIHRRALEIIEKLAKADPADLNVARDLWIAFIKQSDVARETGNTLDAVSAASKSLELAQMHSRKDPGDKGWRLCCSLSLIKVGEGRLAAGEGAAACAAASEAIAIAEGLTSESPDHRLHKEAITAAYDLVGRARANVKL